MTWKERGEAARMLAEEWAAAGKDDLDAEAAARRLGRAKGVLGTARTMLRRGLPAERVAAGLGLSPEEVRRFAAGPDGGPPPEDAPPQETWGERRDRLRRELGRFGRAEALGEAEGSHIAGWRLILAGFTAGDMERYAGFLPGWTEGMIALGPDALRSHVEDPTRHDGPEDLALNWEMGARDALDRMEASRQEGLSEIARSMLAEGLDADKVAKYLDLPPKMVARLAEEARSAAENDADPEKVE